MNTRKTKPILGKKNITINNENYVIRNTYVEHNKIYIICVNKKTQKRKVFSIVQLTDENSIKKTGKFFSIFNSIKNLVNKYIVKKPKLS